MLQQSQLKVSNWLPALTLVKGNEEYLQQSAALARLAWQVAYTALWNAEEFSALEKEKTMEFITAFIRQQPNPLKAYTAFVQRVLLARQYITSHPGTYAPVPTQWFSTANKNGFAGTQRWFEAVENTRASLPKFKEPLRAFAEAIRETVQSGSAGDFHYWRSYFISHNAQALLNLFLSTLANCHY